jgi:hypothetical protein
VQSQKEARNNNKSIGMNLKDIALFKRFIGDNAVVQIFINKYNGEKGSLKNPAAIEDYLSNVDVEQVIPKAFRKFKINSAFGSDFWYTLNQNWLTFHSRMSASNSYNDSLSLSRLEGVFAILRENWNTYTPWRYEPVQTARVRCGLAKIDEAAEAPVEQIADSTKEGDSPVIDFIDVDTSKCRKGTSLQKGMISVNKRNHSWRITVNRTDTADIKAYKFVRLGKVGSDIVMMFKNSQGINVVLKADGYININSSVFV